MFILGSMWIMIPFTEERKKIEKKMRIKTQFWYVCARYSNRDVKPENVIPSRKEQKVWEIVVYTK